MMTGRTWGRDQGIGVEGEVRVGGKGEGVGSGAVKELVMTSR